MINWDPDQYLRFKKDRLRPAEELLGRVEIKSPQLIVDMGCGPGTTTRLLGERFESARITGLDNSINMITKAREIYPQAEYIHSAIGEWTPDERVDLIFANAVLHWLPDHKELIAKFADALNEGGVLAIQMPDNLEEPSHLAIARIAGSPQWMGMLGKQLATRMLLSAPQEYYDRLAEKFEFIDIWRTIYCHVMPGHDHIVEWVKGAALTPFLSLLRDGEREQFLDEYCKEIGEAYPVRRDGNVIYSFPRLFMIAVRRG